MLFLPSPLDEGRPPPATVQWLAADDDWTLAPQLGMLAKVFNQDLYNLPQVQHGLKNLARNHVVFAQYQETKLRHFHLPLQRQLGIDYEEILQQ